MCRRHLVKRLDFLTKIFMEFITIIVTSQFFMAVANLESLLNVGYDQYACYKATFYFRYVIDYCCKYVRVLNTFNVI